MLALKAPIAAVCWYDQPPADDFRVRLCTALSSKPSELVMLTRNGDDWKRQTEFVADLSTGTTTVSEVAVSRNNLLGVVNPITVFYQPHRHVIEMVAVGVSAAATVLQKPQGVPTARGDVYRITLENTQLTQGDPAPVDLQHVPHGFEVVESARVIPAGYIAVVPDRVLPPGQRAVSASAIILAPDQQAVPANAVVGTPDQKLVPANAVVGTPDQKLVPGNLFLVLKQQLQLILDEKARGKDDSKIGYWMGFFAKDGLEWMNQVE